MRQARQQNSYASYLQNLPSWSHFVFFNVCTARLYLIFYPFIPSLPASLLPPILLIPMIPIVLLFVLIYLTLALALALNRARGNITDQVTRYNRINLFYKQFQASVRISYKNVP